MLTGIDKIAQTRRKLISTENYEKWACENATFTLRELWNAELLTGAENFDIINEVNLLQTGWFLQEYYLLEIFSY